MGEQLPTAIGIDFGMKFATVSFIQSEKVNILATVPCYINSEMFHEKSPNSEPTVGGSQRFIGNSVMKDTTLRMTRGLYDIQRWIGRPFSHPEIQHFFPQWNFNLDHIDGHPIYSTVDYDKGSSHRFYPQEILSMLFLHLKSQAEDLLALTINDVVISIPGHFDSYQKVATVDAASIAGFKNVNLVYKPVAAVLSYPQLELPGHCVLVIDLGSSTYELTLVKLKENTVKVKAVGGDPYVGGESFTEALVQYCISIAGLQTGFDVKRIDPGKLGELYLKCEEAKKKLSEGPSEPQNISVEKLSSEPDVNVDVTITEEIFNEINQGLLHKCISVLKDFLATHRIEEMTNLQVLCLGRSMQLPQFRSMLRDSLPADAVILNGDPNSVSHGIFQCAKTKLNFVDMEECLREIIPYIETKTGLQAAHNVGMGYKCSSTGKIYISRCSKIVRKFQIFPAVISYKNTKRFGHMFPECEVGYRDGYYQTGENGSTEKPELLVEFLQLSQHEGREGQRAGDIVSSDCTIRIGPDGSTSDYFPAFKTMPYTFRVMVCKELPVLPGYTSERLTPEMLKQVKTAEALYGKLMEAYMSLPGPLPEEHLKKCHVSSVNGALDTTAAISSLTSSLRARASLYLDELFPRYETRNRAKQGAGQKV